MPGPYDGREDERVEEVTREGQSVESDPRASGSTSVPDPDPHAPATLNTLKIAMRRARFDDAERAGVMAELKAARIGRLEVLRDALAPLIAQIPLDVEMFDIGLMQGVNPRLFIDMIAFIEMSRDSRLYQFFQDTRQGRVLLAENGRVDAMVEAVTNYVARRLLERDKALATEPTSLAEPQTRPAAPSRRVFRNEEPVPPRDPRPIPRRASWQTFAGAAFAFLLNLLGSITFFTTVAAIIWIAWIHLRGPSQ